MALSTYKKKRNFKQTPEPQGGGPGDDGLHFVVQQHAASQLHYDFRLEMGGVLKSWAVPKGPSTDASVKRLAVMVEDHPYDYRNFEGIIPSGYGAGTVIVWDEGLYEPSGFSGASKKIKDKEIRRQLRSGRLKVTLSGKKLRGDFALVKTSGRGDTEWLLFKVKDRFASSTDITLKNKSVVSERTLLQVGKQAANEGRTKNKALTVQPTRKTAAAQKGRKVKLAHAEKQRKSVESAVLLEQAPARKNPVSMQPMLATLVDKPFGNSEWSYEIKWDGYRALAFLNKGKVKLKSRNNKSFSERFYPVTQALEAWDIDAVLDGEIVVLEENGISSFGKLQNWRTEADGFLFYYVFDILWLHGKSLLELTLTDRRKILEAETLPKGDIIRISRIEKNGVAFFKAAKKAGLEGIIAKKSSSLYYPGERSGEWLKIKAAKRQEMLIGGFTKNEDSPKYFSSLLLGVYEKGKLIYKGKVGTGFNEKLQREMMTLFKPLVVKTPPFQQLPDINKASRFRPYPPHAKATWLKPALVCEISFAEMTTDGLMRHPSFAGLRSDKEPNAVSMEQAKPTAKTLREARIIKKQGSVASVHKERKTLVNPAENTLVKKINGHDLTFTNLRKIYWPKEKITKGDLLNYYHQVSPYIMPYLKDRPQSMHRHPDGINGKSFYFKDISGKAPDWVSGFLYRSEADSRDREYLVAKDEASLLYMASLGCIEMNPWHSRVEREAFPDWCIIDLDPGKNSFDKVIETARVTRDVLEELGVSGYPKTSGSAGMHIYIPLGAKYNYEQSKEFARVVATLVQEKIPHFTSMERTVKDRKGKLYIDFLQNRPQATVAAPYSLRPKPGATVSMPLPWEEVRKGLKMMDFTIFNALDRIRSQGDIFKPVLAKGIDLKAVIRTFGKRTSGSK